MAPCSPEEGVIVPNELNKAGFCAKSHPGYAAEARDDETYPQLYGWSKLVPYGADGILNTRDFFIRGDKTGQALTLWRNSTIVEKWQGTNGPKGFDLQTNDVITWFADDSSINEENFGFKVCVLPP